MELGSARNEEVMWFCFFFLNWSKIKALLYSVAQWLEISSYKKAPNSLKMLKYNIPTQVVSILFITPMKCPEKFLWIICLLLYIIFHPQEWNMLLHIFTCFCKKPVSCWQDMHNNFLHVLGVIHVILPLSLILSCNI